MVNYPSLSCLDHSSDSEEGSGPVIVDAIASVVKDVEAFADVSVENLTILKSSYYGPFLSGQCLSWERCSEIVVQVKVDQV